MNKSDKLIFHKKTVLNFSNKAIKILNQFGTETKESLTAHDEFIS